MQRPAFASLLCFFVAVSLWIVLPSAALEETHRTDGLRLRWSLGTLIDGPDSLRFAPIQKDTTLKSGDYLKIYLKISRPAYVYLVYCDPHGQVVPFFAIHRNASGRVIPLITFGPWSLEAYDNGDDTFYFPPVGAEWVSLDQNAGEERFYMLASVEPLEDLHALLTAIQQAPATQQAELSNKVLAEIKRLLKQYLARGDVAEKPKDLGGTLRGMEDPSPSIWENWDLYLTRQVIEIEGPDLYLKPLSINHVPAPKQTPPLQH